MSLFFLSSCAVPSKPWWHSSPETTAPMLFLGFFQAPNTSFANRDACDPALTTVQHCRLGDPNCEAPSGMWKHKKVRSGDCIWALQSCGRGNDFSRVMPYLPLHTEALFQHLGLAVPHALRSQRHFIRPSESYLTFFKFPLLNVTCRHGIIKSCFKGVFYWATVMMQLIVSIMPVRVVFSFLKTIYTWNFNLS